MEFMFRRLIYTLFGKNAYIYLEAARQRTQYTRFRYPDSESRLLDRFVRSGDVCFDVGANLGSYTFYLSRLVGTAGRVYAFEPVPATYRGLQANLKADRLTNVRAYNLGVSNCTGVTRIFVPHINGLPSHGRAHLSGRGDDEIGQYYDARLTTIDEFYSTARLDRVDFIKMDIEGAELHAVQGAVDVIRLHRPILLLEVEAQHTKRHGYRPIDLFDYLESHGYIHILYWDGTSLGEFDRRLSLQQMAYAGSLDAAVEHTGNNLFFVPSDRIHYVMG